MLMVSCMIGEVVGAAGVDADGDVAGRMPAKAGTGVLNAGSGVVSTACSEFAVCWLIEESPKGVDREPGAMFEDVLYVSEICIGTPKLVVWGLADRLENGYAMAGTSWSVCMLSVMHSQLTNKRACLWLWAGLFVHIHVRLGTGSVSTVMTGTYILMNHFRGS